MRWHLLTGYPACIFAVASLWRQCLSQHCTEVCSDTTCVDLHLLQCCSCFWPAFCLLLCCIIRFSVCMSFCTPLNHPDLLSVKAAGLLEASSLLVVVSFLHLVFHRSQDSFKTTTLACIRIYSTLHFMILPSSFLFVDFVSNKYSIMIIWLMFVEIPFKCVYCSFDSLHRHYKSA